MHRSACALLLLFGGLGPVAAADDPATAFARGDYAAVVAQLEPAYRAGGAPLQQHLLLARAWLRLERAQQAVEALAEVLAVDVDHPEANRLAGEALVGLGRHADALVVLKKAYRTAPDSATAGLLGRCYFALGDSARAKEMLDQAVAEDVRDPTLSLILARIHLARGSGTLAEQQLLLAQEAGLDASEVHQLLGRAYLLQRKLVGPMVRRRPAGTVVPGALSEGWIAIAPAGSAGEWLLCSRFCALAEGLWLVGADARSADGHALAAAGWLAAGRSDSAAPHLAALAVAEPDSVRRLTLAAEAALAAVDAAALDAVIVRAQATAAPGTALIVTWLRRLALAQAARGASAAAIATLVRADALDPASAAVLRALAELRSAAGERAAAALCYQRLIDLFPDAPDVDELRNARAALLSAAPVAP